MNLDDTIVRQPLLEKDDDDVEVCEPHKKHEDEQRDVELRRVQLYQERGGGISINPLSGQ